MEDLPTSLLTQQEKAKSRTGEELETFGKHAASVYLKGECETLSEAVVETVKSAGLGPEQVRRVVEFTNTNAYLQKFASEGPQHKVVNFKGGPASFPDVIRDLNDGGGGSVFDKAASASLTDYLLPPPDLARATERGLARLGLVDEKLAAAFHTDEVPLPYEEPLRDAADLKDKLAGLRDEATHELSGLETRYMDLCDLLYGQVKQAALEGTPLGHLVSALGTVTQEPEFFKAAFAMLTPRLVDNEVFQDEVAVASSLEKFAGAGLVNPAHPMIGIFEDYCETLQKLAATRAVREETVESIETLSTFLTKAASLAGQAGTIAGEVASLVPKGWGVAKRLATRAAEPVGEFATSLGGETAGDAVRWGVEHTPHLAVGLAAEEAYQRAKNNPGIQAATNFAAARIPYTHQNMMRQYALQQGLSY